MALLHVSTAYVCGRRDGPIAEEDPLPETGFANGYEASKAAGERLVRASGLTWATARPSIVVGASDTGAIRQFDTTYAAFKLIALSDMTQLVKTVINSASRIPPTIKPTGRYLRNPSFSASTNSGVPMSL